jgi:Domain of unknown function (DUF6894)
MGLEFPDLDAAYLEAFEAAREMWVEALREMRNPGRQQFEISDETGNTLLVVPFREVLESLKGVPKPHPVQMAERAAKLSSEVAEAIQRARMQLTEAKTLLAQLSASSPRS